MAYNNGNFLRRLALPRLINDWSLRTMREKLVKLCTKTVILSSLASKNRLFCQEIQSKVLSKGNSGQFRLIRLGWRKLCFVTQYGRDTFERLQFFYR